MIDPILLQNKEVIDKVYEHINIMSSMTKYNNNKLIIYCLGILMLYGYYHLNKEKIMNSLEFIKNINKDNLYRENTIKNVVVEEEDINEIEEELSDFEY